MTEERATYTTDGREPDALDRFAFAEDHFVSALMMVFWKARHANPEFTITVDSADLKGFQDCIQYLEVTPTIRVYRPQGLPAQEAVPATGKRRAVPGRPAKPPADYVVVQMVDKDGNSIKAVENNDADYERAGEAAKLRTIRDSAPGLAAQLEADVRSNTLSTSTILEAAAALKVLARA